ncbi:Uma2 family endonuclease [Anaerolineales bacterium HSG25]|nr:Uma2 family endonuclease [Anaerolineales bacterium HSG25]
MPNHAQLMETVSDYIIPQSREGMQVSEAEYWKNYYEHPDFNYEWNNGILEEVPMADLINYRMYQWFIKLLIDFLEIHPIATTVGLEMGFRLALTDETKIRKPDLGVVLHTNPVPIKPTDRTYDGVFDMCIESVSDSTRKEKERDTVAKYAEYAEVGVKEYFVLYASGEEIAFYRFNDTLRVYEEINPIDGIIRSEVLPGFQFQLDDLFRQPTYNQMSDDPVYQGFIGLKYQQAQVKVEQIQAETEQAQAKAVQEQQRAEQAQAKVEQEKAKNDRLTAYLRQIGIDPESIPDDIE